MALSRLSAVLLVALLSHFITPALVLRVGSQDLARARPAGGPEAALASTDAGGLGVVEAMRVAAGSLSSAERRFEPVAVRVATPAQRLFAIPRRAHYPAAYGFVPGTQADDGDPLDILVMTTEPTFTGCLIDARPVGIFRMRDEKGEDEKVLAVPTADPRYSEVTELAHVAPHFLREVEHFFEIYKELEGKSVETFGWEPRESAYEVIRRSIAAAPRSRSTQ